MIRPLRTMLVAGLVCLTAPLAARPAQEPEPPPLFKSESNLVVLHVNVFNGRSDAVPNLPQSAFRVTEDNRPQSITFFSNEDVPVAVGLVLDNSGSMIARRAMVLAGTRAFAASSHPEDELFTIVFNEHIRRGLPETIAFTKNRLQIEAGVNRYAPGGQTAFHDAVIAALEHLRRLYRTQFQSVVSLSLETVA